MRLLDGLRGGFGLLAKSVKVQMSLDYLFFGHELMQGHELLFSVNDCLRAVFEFGRALWAIFVALVFISLSLS